MLKAVFFVIAYLLGLVLVFVYLNYESKQIRGVFKALDEIEKEIKEMQGD